MVERPERYCSNCGHELKPEDQFCSNCGMPVHRTARVPTPKADRPVPPLPPPTQEVGRRRSLPGSGALRGRGRKLVVILVLVVLLLYLVLPLVMESLIAWRLQTAFGTPTKPAVEVSSNFPPMMLLGRFDSVQVRMDQASLQGATLYNTRADLAGKTSTEKYSVPYRISAPANPRSANGSTVLVEPPHFAQGTFLRESYLGRPFLFGRGFLHASVGYSTTTSPQNPGGIYRILDPTAKGVFIRGESSMGTAGPTTRSSSTSLARSGAIRLHAPS
jgi:hypothetical protein